MVGEAEAGARRIQRNHRTVDYHEATVEELQAQLWGRQGEAAQIQRLAAQVGELKSAAGLQRGAGGRVVGSGPKLQLPGVEGSAELQGAGGADHKRIARAEALQLQGTGPIEGAHHAALVAAIGLTAHGPEQAGGPRCRLGHRQVEVVVEV